MRRRRALGAAVAAMTALVVGTLTGCGLPLGGSSSASRVTVTASVPAARARAAVTQAPRTHELPTAATPQRAPGGWRSPVQAVQVFAQTYINWTTSTVGPRLRLLAQVSIGQARAAMALAAAQTGRDSDLRRGGIVNSGTVEAIAPVTGERNVYAVVTRERTTATNSSAYRGLAPTWHVSLATVTRVEHGLWTLRGWQPES